MCTFRYTIVLQLAKYMWAWNSKKMVEPIIHCLGNSCPLILFCIDYDSKKQMFKVKSVLEDVIVGCWCVKLGPTNKGWNQGPNMEIALLYGIFGIFWNTIFHLAKMLLKSYTRDGMWVCA
jgi:hypothetical protein